MINDILFRKREGRGGWECYFYRKKRIQKFRDNLRLSFIRHSNFVSQVVEIRLICNKPLSFIWRSRYKLTYVFGLNNYISETMDGGGRKYIYLEGNIASGKSCILEQLEAQFQTSVHVQYEPLHEWQNYRQKFNLLNELYKDPQKNAFKFQIVAQITQTRRELNLDDISKQYFFFERSIRTQRIFIETLFKRKEIDELDFSILQDLYNLMPDQIEKYDIIYLKTDVDTCMKRIYQRGRHEEFKISYEYLKALNDAHDKWLLTCENCLIIDGTLPVESIVSVIKNKYDLK